MNNTSLSDSANYELQLMLEDLENQESIDKPTAFWEKTSRQSMVLCPWQLPLLQGRFNLAVNFISFQEMESEVVQNYLNEIDRLETTYVLLRNLREGKPKLSDGAVYGVKTPILGDDYDRFLSNYDLIGTNVVPYDYKTVDGSHFELRLYCCR